MSNDNDSHSDESGKTIDEAKQVLVDESSTEEDRAEAQKTIDDSNVQAEAEKQIAERKDQAYQHQLKNEISKVANGEKGLDDVPEWLRDDAKKRIEKLRETSPKPEVDEDKLFEEFEARSQKKEDLKVLSEEEQEKYNAEYNDLIDHKYTHNQAVKKTRQSLNILSNEEKAKKAEIDGVNAIPVGQALMPRKSSNEIKPVTDLDKKFAKALEESRGIKL